MSRRDKPFASLIYTKKLKTYPQPMKSLNLWKKYQFSHLHNLATRFVKKIVKQIRANLKPKNERHSQQCFPPLLTFSRISAYTDLVYLISFWKKKKEKEKKPQLEKIKEIS